MWPCLTIQNNLIFLKFFKRLHSFGESEESSYSILQGERGSDTEPHEILFVWVKSLIFIDISELYKSVRDLSSSNELNFGGPTRSGAFRTVPLTFLAACRKNIKVH